MPKDIENMRNSKAFLADPATADPIGDLGNRAAINYWMNGGVSFDFDRDPISFGLEGGSLKRTREDEEGSEAFVHDVDVHLAMATLQHFPDA